MDTAWHIQGQPKNLKEWQSQLRRLEVNGAKNMTETVEIKKEGKAGRQTQCIIEVLIHQVHVTTYVVKFFSGHRNFKEGYFKSVFHVESKKRTHSGDHAFNV